MTDSRDSRAQRAKNKYKAAAREFKRGKVCAVCGTGIDLTIDHSIPLSKGGVLMDQSGWVVLCRRHNSVKGNRRLKSYRSKLFG